MIEIIPAVLPRSIVELREGLSVLKGVSALVQIDIVADILGSEEALPMWEEFDFEFDIFLDHPERIVEQCVALGGSRIVVHAGHSGAREALEALQPRRDGEYAVATGLGLAVFDTLDTLEPFAGLYDFVQVMGIVNEGRQGEPFDEHAVSLTRALRAAYPQLFIQVDGHTAGHEQVLAEAGANRLIVGSAILGADDPKRAYEEVYTRANAH
ncbi:hypothetical protein A3D70_00970 [Candidatus Adlerbacteria bacterium RIFCSPHIGHO2_02_FULL_54_18]|uniref:Orotidine 5'-phosphate decarboxylase domain-containing protein n=2 Tax=Candidatus Adleribacteriota TaxID=1752736 RepID=A0A1F4Y3B4_9BACT|nr:MAG: hypothetical protein A2949_01285 [Candidatus Adlerbacteria bacterium RIFCSPLOWO2_01_FULL_54_21b]OGC88266.1 MAG: hypothetical protein A3D70_00970 [Candidatus Adlerbacteria bacterium RIFCSPHIGHO2_02_FULL_54_18]